MYYDVLLLLFHFMVYCIHGYKKCHPMHEYFIILIIKQLLKNVDQLHHTHFEEKKYRLKKLDKFLFSYFWYKKHNKFCENPIFLNNNNINHEIRIDLSWVLIQYCIKIVLKKCKKYNN